MTGQRLLRRREVLTAGAVGLTALAGCSGDGSNGLDEADSGDGTDSDTDSGSGSGSGSGSDGGTIKIGVLAPESGALSRFGREMADTARLAQQQVAVSENGYEIDLAVEDTETDPDTAVEKAQSLVDDGYHALVGPGADESATSVTEEVLVPESVVAISPLAAAGMVDIEDDDFLYGTAPRANDVARGLARPVALEGASSIGILAVDNRYGRTISERAVEEFETRGTEVTSNATVEQGASSYADALEAATSEDPDGLAVVSGPATGTQLLTEYYADFGEKPVFVSDRLRLPDFPSEVEGDMSEVLAVGLQPAWEYEGNRRTPDDDETTDDGAGNDAPQLDTFFQAFRGEYDRIPTSQAAQTFDATVTLVLASVSARETTGSAVRDAISKVTDPDAAAENVESYGDDNYWTGMADVEQGLPNNYYGPTGEVTFAENTGILDDFRLNASRFARDTTTGFEEVLPLPLRIAPGPVR